MPMVYTLVCAVIEKINKDNEDRKVFEKNEKERLERQREEEELVCLSYNFSFSFDSSNRSLVLETIRRYKSYCRDVLKMESIIR